MARWATAKSLLAPAARLIQSSSQSGGEVVRKGSVAFANFVCTFGDKGGLLDFSEIVIPAFTTDTLVRRYGSNHFHFYNVEVVELGDAGGDSILGISGHFVKNVQLTREQVFHPTGGLVKSKDSMESSPSSYFLLILNTHRLIYFAETAHAPDLKSFEATVSHFIKKVRSDRVNQSYRNAVGGITRRTLEERLPRPTLKVVPLSEPERISEYLARFSTIKTVRFRLIRPNHETDASEVVSAVRGRFGPLQPDRLDIIASRSDGLDKDEVTQAVEEATGTGNTNVDLSGEDLEGLRLRGNNEQFALTVDLDKPAKSDEGLRNQLYGKYTALLASGKIKIGAGLNGASDKLAKIAAML